MFNLEFKKINKVFGRNISGRFCSGDSCGWATLLVFFVVLNLAVIIFSTYLYYKIGRGEAFVADEKIGDSKGFVRINKGDLDEIIYDFSLKSDSFKELKQQKSLGIIDPSL